MLIFYINQTGSSNLKFIAVYIICMHKCCMHSAYNNCLQFFFQIPVDFCVSAICSCRFSLQLWICKHRACCSFFTIRSQSERLLYSLEIFAHFFKAISVCWKAEALHLTATPMLHSPRFSLTDTSNMSSSEKTCFKLQSFLTWPCWCPFFRELEDFTNLKGSTSKRLNIPYIIWRNVILQGLFSGASFPFSTLLRGTLGTLRSK